MMNFTPVTRRFRGYVALISSLLISSMLTVLVLSVNAQAFLARADLSNEESYQEAQVAAESCARMALYSVSIEEHRFDGASPITLPLEDEAFCVIRSVLVQGSDAFAPVDGYSAHSYVRRYAQGSRNTKDSPFELVSWKRFGEDSK